MGWRAFSVAAPSVGLEIKSADYPRDPAIELNSVRFKTFLFAYCQAQCIERTRDIMTMRYTK